MAKKRDPLKATAKPKVPGAKAKPATTKTAAKKAPAKKTTTATKKPTISTAKIKDNAVKAPARKSVKAETKVVTPEQVKKTKFWTPPKVIGVGFAIVFVLLLIFG